jgi:hypothetical protein
MPPGRQHESTPGRPKGEYRRAQHEGPPVSTPPKYLPTLTEVVADKPAVPVPPGPPVPSVAESRPADAREVDKLIEDHEVARLEEQLVRSHWLEQRLSPALRDWVEQEVSNEVAAQLEALAPLWAKTLAEAVSKNVMARIPGIVDRLLEEAERDSGSTPER